MMINSCSSTSNPLPEIQDFITPPLVEHPMDPEMFTAAMEGNTYYLQTFQDLSNLQLKRTICNETVLHIATQFNQMAFARLSIQFCPPLLSLVNSSGDTALHIAAREGHTEIVELFLSCYDPNLTRMLNLENDTALHCCARRGNTECVKLLVEADPEVCGFLNKAHESPLYLSISSECMDVSREIKCIIEYAGSSASHKGPNGLTALHAAVLWGRHAKDDLLINKWEKQSIMIKQLVEWRREMLRECDNFGMIPLHSAVHGKIEATRLILEYDSLAIYCLNNDGQSILHIAAFFGEAEVLEELVKCRPDCYNMVDNKGRTALHAAVLGNQHRVVELILKTPSLARLINKVDKDGNTPLHLAAYFKSYKIIKSLRETKIYFNHNSYTPLDVYQGQFNNLKEWKLFEGKDVSECIVANWHLDFYNGVTAINESTKEELKRMNKWQYSTEEISSRNGPLKKSAESKRGDHGVESSLEVNLLVAMLVATVTFTAGFTVPGGLVDDGVDEGLANFTNKPAFEAFVVFNTLAFFCSIYAVLVHFITSLLNRRARVYYKGIATSFTAVAIVAMVLAFCCGTYVMLTKSTALSLVSYCILASFLLIYPISRLLNVGFKIWNFGGPDISPINRLIFFLVERKWLKEREAESSNRY